MSYHAWHAAPVLLPKHDPSDRQAKLKAANPRPSKIVLTLYFIDRKTMACY